MMRLMKMLNNVITFFYIWIVAIVRKNQNIATDKVAIIIGGNMGDALIAGQAIGRLIDYYLHKGKEIYIICGVNLYRILQLTTQVNPMIHYIDCSLTAAKMKSFCKSKKLIGKVKNLECETVIVIPNNQMFVHYLAMCIPANIKWTVLNDLKAMTFGKRIRQISYRFYSNIVMVDSDTPQTERLRKLLMMLGLDRYDIHITPIPAQKNKVNIRQSYITVAVDSSSLHKRWPLERWISLIHGLLQKYSYSIVVVGNNVSASEKTEYETLSRESPRVINLIGKTSFLDWIEIIRGAVYHIGVDSGSVHVAASVGTKAICLAGVWDGRRIFPYHIEKVLPGTDIPLCVYRSDVNVDYLRCRNCSPKGGYGYGNHECKKRCNAGLSCLCLSQITLDDVMNAIEQANIGEE